MVQHAIILIVVFCLISVSGLVIGAAKMLHLIGIGSSKVTDPIRKSATSGLWKTALLELVLCVTATACLVASVLETDSSHVVTGVAMAAAGCTLLIVTAHRILSPWSKNEESMLKIIRAFAKQQKLHYLGLILVWAFAFVLEIVVDISVGVSIWSDKPMIPWELIRLVCGAFSLAFSVVLWVSLERAATRKLTQQELPTHSSPTDQKSILSSAPTSPSSSYASTPTSSSKSSVSSTPSTLSSKSSRAPSPTNLSEKPSITSLASTAPSSNASMPSLYSQPSYPSPTYAGSPNHSTHLNNQPTTAPIASSFATRLQPSPRGVIAPSAIYAAYPPPAASQQPPAIPSRHSSARSYNSTNSNGSDYSVFSPQRDSHLALRRAPSQRLLTANARYHNRLRILETLAEPATGEEDTTPSRRSSTSTSPSRAGRPRSRRGSQKVRFPVPAVPAIDRLKWEAQGRHPRFTPVQTRRFPRDAGVEVVRSSPPATPDVASVERVSPQTAATPSSNEPAKQNEAQVKPQCPSEPQSTALRVSKDANLVGGRSRRGIIKRKKTSDAPAPAPVESVIPAAPVEASNKVAKDLLTLLDLEFEDGDIFRSSIMGSLTSVD